MNQPDTLGQYRLIERIGEGGMGIVHLGVSPHGDLVAVKALRPWLVGGHDGRARFAREVATLQRVKGSRVAEVVDADVSHDPPYVVTRYVRGSSLDKVIDDHGPLRTEALTRLASGLAEAVASVHAAGVVHRDIKPGNVMMTDDGPVLIDFGLARAVDETRLTATGLVIGTPGYLSPEVVEGKPPGPATDVHGWAATVVFAGTGKPPYGKGPDAAVLDRIRRGDHDMGDIDPDLASIVRSALAGEPASRPAISHIQQRLDGGGPEAPTVVSAVPPPSASDVPTSSPADDPTMIASRTQNQPAPASARPVHPPAHPKPMPIGPGPNGMAPPLATWPARLAVAAFGLMLLILLGVAPALGTIVLFAGLVVARVTWRTRRNLYERRIARGRQPRDHLVAAVGAPWYVFVAALPSALQTVLIGICGLLVGAAVDLGENSGVRMPFIAGGLVVLGLAWLGPATGRVRHGVRALAAPLDRDRRTAWIVVGVLLAISWVLLMVWESYGSAWPPFDPPGNVLDGQS